MRVLVTGGAGFVGANLAVGLTARHESWHVVALDNLRRRGSDLNLPRLHAAGVRFVHGDVRLAEDVAAAGPFDALVECSAEPSVLAGVESPDYVVGTNLVGAHTCLDACRRCGAQFVFCSTSRVYPLAGLRSLRLDEDETRFRLADDQEVPGASAAGISEAFPLAGARTLYGATKLAAELLTEEYAGAFDLRTVVNRFGVIAGPWQMGKIDQGVLTYWLLAHRFGRPLRYLGYGGTGKQVRDAIHVEDAVDLIDEQLGDPEGWAGTTANVGGGADRSFSLLELTALCRELTGETIQVSGSDEERPGDVPLFITDSRHLFERTSWRPARDLETILADVDGWIAGNRSALAPLLG